MHDAVLEWVGCFSSQRADISVLDIGGRNVNGSPRHLFPNARYVALDIAPGDDVDIVADAADWEPSERFDVVLCTEVFEHTSRWPEIVRTAFAACKPGGAFIATAAAIGRPPHSAIDENPIRPEEWYENIAEDRLCEVLEGAGFVDIVINLVGATSLPRGWDRRLRARERAMAMENLVGPQDIRAAARRA